MSSKSRLLLIEDEEDIASLIKLQAELYGYSIHVEVDGLNGFLAVKREKPDLIILDIMLPGKNGFDVCRKIKSDPELKSIPVIILSAKGDEIDLVLGLELGADDYVTKPFSPKVLFSRVKAVLRRQAPQASVPSESAGGEVYKFGAFELDSSKYQVKKNGKSVPLTLSEFGILHRLISNRGRVMTRNQLLDNIQNDNAFIVDRNIDVHIAALRKKLGPGFDMIETVRGVGYRFTED